MTDGTPATQAAKAATKSIPIVFQIAADPVERGFVDSLPKPGTNLTGADHLVHSGKCINARFWRIHALLVSWINRTPTFDVRLRMTPNPCAQPVGPVRAFLLVSIGAARQLACNVKPHEDDAFD